MFFVIGSFLEMRNQNPFKHLGSRFLQKNICWFYVNTTFRKRLHVRCLTGF